MGELVIINSFGNTEKANTLFSYRTLCPKCNNRMMQNIDCFIRLSTDLRDTIFFRVKNPRVSRADREKWIQEKAKVSTINLSKRFYNYLVSKISDDIEHELESRIENWSITPEELLRIIDEQYGVANIAGTLRVPPILSPRVGVTVEPDSIEEDESDIDEEEEIEEEIL
jgi:hypothetical protein